MDYYFLVLWTELWYHMWLTHAVSVSCNTVLLHTRVSIYNNIYIYILITLISHVFIMFICILHHVILTVYYFLLLVLSTHSHDPC